MNRSKLGKVLKEIGLNDHEATLYLAALSCGPSSVANLASVAGLKRTTAYDVLEELQARGLINQEMRGFKRLFAATSPEFLESVLTSRLNVLRNSLPEFMSLFNQKGSMGVIKYYEGLPAVKTVYDRLLKTAQPGEPYNVLSNTDKWYSLDPVFFEAFIKNRSKRQLFPRHILADSQATREYAKKIRSLGGKVKILPKTNSFSMNLVIIPKMVILHQLVPPIYAVVFESPMVVELLQQVYEIMWQSVPD